jgi:hypothetical protein
VCDKHNDAAPFVQGACTDPAPRKSAGNSRLNPWIFQVLTDRKLSRKARAVALYLRDTFDVETGFTSPSFRQIAAVTRISRGAAERAVRRLAPTGHLRIDHGCGGGGNSNIYKMTEGPR